MLARNEIWHYFADTFIGAKNIQTDSTSDLILLCPPFNLGDIRWWVTSPTSSLGSELTMSRAMPRYSEFKYFDQCHN